MSIPEVLGCRMAPQEDGECLQKATLTAHDGRDLILDGERSEVIGTESEVKVDLHWGQETWI